MPKCVGRNTSRSFDSDNAINAAWITDAESLEVTHGSSRISQKLCALVLAAVVLHSLWSDLNSDVLLIKASVARELGVDDSTNQLGSRPVVITPSAVQRRRDSYVVFTIRGGRVTENVVHLGASTPEGQVVVAGLSAGAQVAVSNLDSLTDGMTVGVAP